MFEFLVGYQDWSLLLLRVVLALVFLVHGWPKLIGLKNTWTMFDSMGFKPGMLWGTVVAMLEVFGGLGILLGVYLVPLSFLLALQMLVATLWKMKAGQKFAGYEIDLLLVVALYALATIGGGVYVLF